VSARTDRRGSGQHYMGRSRHGDRHRVRGRHATIANSSVRRDRMRVACRRRLPAAVSARTDRRGSGQHYMGRSRHGDRHRVRGRHATIANSSVRRDRAAWYRATLQGARWFASGTVAPGNTVRGAVDMTTHRTMQSSMIPTGRCGAARRQGCGPSTRWRHTLYQVARGIRSHTGQDRGNMMPTIQCGAA